MLTIHRARSGWKRRTIAVGRGSNHCRVQPQSNIPKVYRLPKLLCIFDITATDGDLVTKYLNW